MSLRIFTIGHSTRSFDELLEILRGFHIEVVVDVRSIPQSRYNPQFNLDAIRGSLETGGIEYIHLAGLGGLRHTTKSSINTAWKNLSFRGYADYMQTPEFRNSLEQLVDIAHEKMPVIMCAEAVPWRCHRSLIGDALLARGFQVEDILSREISKPHRLTPWAKVDGQTVVYPGPTPQNNLS
jgi:uncharacterized protein (DUF488 family)